MFGVLVARWESLQSARRYSLDINFNILEVLFLLQNWFMKHNEDSVPYNLFDNSAKGESNWYIWLS